MPAGRPSEYTFEIAEVICALIAQGKTILHICALDNMPSHTTLCNWLRKHPEFVAQYARARQEQAEYFADEMIVIADTELDPQVARVRIDARKWHASKSAPKKYGDRIVQEHTGTDGGPIKTESEVTLRPSITREEWEKRYAMATAAGTAISGT